LDDLEQAEVLVLAPPVLRPVDVGVTADPAERFHIEKTLRAQSDFTDFTGFEIHGFTHEGMLVATLESELGPACRDIDFKSPVAIKKRQREIRRVTGEHQRHECLAG